MLGSSVSVLVPCRAGSQRIKDKNTRPISSYRNGLLEIKLNQLVDARFVDKIIVSTDDPVVKHVANEFKQTCSKPIDIIDRPHELAISDSLDAFLHYVPTIMPDGISVWTHVTSPFFDAKAYDFALETYEEKVVKGEHDSLMSVNPIKSFVWSKNGCLSHDRDIVKWPQTQDLDHIFEVNSAIFIMDRKAMLERRDRVGDNPFLLESNFLEGFDVDWPEDIKLAEALINSGF